MINYKEHDAKFAFWGTINWMRSLAILIDSKKFEDSLVNNFTSIKIKKINESNKSLIYEYLLFGLHYISSLLYFTISDSNPYNFVRIAIISWYYSIYYFSKAMITAVSSSSQENHTKTINVYQNQIIDKKLAIFPFNFYLNSIVESEVEKSIMLLRNGNTFGLGTKPKSEEQALGGIFSYLKGTAKFEKEKKSKKILRDSNFKKLNVTNFRTRKAQEFRDNILSRVKVNFLTQAFRFRGKANYRDSIYLSYGEENIKELNIFLKDLELVANGYFKMSFNLVKISIPKDIKYFSNELQKNIRFDLNKKLLDFIIN